VHNFFVPCFWYAGQYLYEEVAKLPEYEVAFVWNRTDDKMKGVVPDHLILQDLSDVSSR
jgi:hypothetical protein